MPIFEFYCPENHRVYSFLARTRAEAEITPRCPDNPVFALRREISPFAFVGRAKDPATLPDPAENAEDARMEAAMAEMEREFSSIGDTDNPDPRMLARMMRRMTELTGEATPPEMEEMVRRLEAGEDPEKLEEQFGDALGGPGEGPDDPYGEGPPPPAAPEPKEAPGRKWKLRLRAPSRDPNLYDVRDYLPAAPA